MKKVITSLMTVLVLSACANSGNGFSTAGNLGTSAVQMYVQNKCTTELQSRNEWRMVALTMSAEKQAEWENKICSCASEEAPKQLTAADMTQLLTESGRTQVAADVTVKTVSACYKKLFSK